MKTIVHAAIVSILLATLPLAAYVTNSTQGGAVQATIQAAVNAAISGDTLLVSTGHYVENVYISQKSLQILGGYHADFLGRTTNATLTCINGNGSGTGVRVYSNCTVLLENVMVTNGAAFVGGGMLIAEGVSLTARLCVIRDNLAWAGAGGAVGTNSTLVLEDTPVYNNTAPVIGGGGIYAVQGATLILNGSATDIRNNFGAEGGGICADNATVLHQGNADVYDNIAGTQGGGMCLVNGAHARITGSGSIVGVNGSPNMATNSGARGGGVYVKDSTLVVENTAGIWENHTTGSGGGIYATNSTVTVRNNAVIGNLNNTVSNYAGLYGGGIFAMDSSLIVSNATIRHGFAGNVGGGVFLWNSSGVFMHAAISNNSALSEGGGVYAYLTSSVAMTDCLLTHNRAIFGGALRLNSVVHPVRLAATHLVSNVATAIAGIYASTCDDIRLDPGCTIAHNWASAYVAGYFIACDQIVLDTIVLASNVTTDVGAGITCISCPSVDIRDSDFTDNAATNYGGSVVFAQSQGRLRTAARPSALRGNRGHGGNAVLLDNSTLAIEAPLHPLTVADNDGIGVGSGIMCINRSTVTVAGAVVFMSNTAWQGGALFASNHCVVTVLPTNGIAPRFVGNAALENGGAVALMFTSRLTAVNCTFADNAATNYGGACYINGSGADFRGDFSQPGTTPPCVFMDNTASLGGACYGLGSLLSLQDAFIASNRAVTLGGGIRSNGGSMDMANCIVVRNTAGTGGGIAMGGATPLKARHCIIAENSFEGVISSGGAMAFSNCIAWANDGVEITAGHVVNYCDVDGGYATGTGNLNVNPVFTNTAALDYRLAPGSPCVDAGIACGVARDCIGAARPQGLGYDMGAYELDPGPRQAVTPLWLDFGEVVVDTSTSLAVQVANAGNSVLTGTVNNVPVPTFTVAPGSYVLGIGATTGVVVTFTPPVEYAWTQTIFFASNGGTSDVTLVGTGVPEPAAAVLFVIGAVWSASIIRCAGAQRRTKRV